MDLVSAEEKQAYLFGIQLYLYSRLTFWPNGLKLAIM